MLRSLDSDGKVPNLPSLNTLDATIVVATVFYINQQGAFYV